MYIKSLMEAAKASGYTEFEVYLLGQQIATNSKLTNGEQKLLYKKLSELQPLDSSMVGVFFTGHRPTDLWGYENMTPYRNLFLRFTDVLRELSKKHNNIVVYVGGAQGVDMIAQEAAVTLGINTILCRPSAEYNLRWKNGGFFSKDAFEKRTKNASLNNSLREVIVSDRNDVSSLEIRNMYMANHCHICIACKIPQKTSGGTYNAWRYAKNAGLEIVLIDPFEGENQVIPAPLTLAEKDFLAKFPSFPDRNRESAQHCLLPLTVSSTRVPVPAVAPDFVID
jgi:hypothetical protein